MEDSFKARVERLFGSHLFETVPKSSFPNTSWSVVEGEVEKKEWNRERGEARPGREDTPLASTYDECFAKSSARSRKSKRRQFEDDIEDIEDAEEEEKGEEAGEEDGEGVDSEERDIRSSIGLDSTLDYEVIYLFVLVLFLRVREKAPCNSPFRGLLKLFPCRNLLNSVK